MSVRRGSDGDQSLLLPYLHLIARPRSFFKSEVKLSVIGILIGVVHVYQVLLCTKGTGIVEADLDCPLSASNVVLHSYVYCDVLVKIFMIYDTGVILYSRRRGTS